MTKDCREETNIAPVPRACCGEKTTPPGVAVVYVDRGNLRRNVILEQAGNPSRLPAIVVRRDGRRMLATRVVFKGEVTMVQDDSKTPAVWLEAEGPIEAYVREMRLDPI